ncbi:TetR/AcrR family transcriptional regulator [Natronosporangium hydrolyticum]|uniref:TetR/AcrR family transcriptional regulator n=1 Tax=Natronosporangium hydrolyticum TaxID=2811111 RepID=A0A895Y9L4_9ACTN|nr:TetR/AcrR family transcriptional regulator [Natronosporangium hydrolyticum]QSB13005.1 TetR/AcrR family transcriptional regulator [Natronosporangium hydrolyticum]
MSELSSTAERTRRAIMLAGIEVLAAHPSAPLAEIAAKAGVSRSTFHRYFADRAALKEAIGALAEQEWQQAVARARLDEGSGLDAFRRLCGELMGSLDILFWWSNEMAAEEGEERSEEDNRIDAALARGHADGSIDATLSTEWITTLLWAVLYSLRYVTAKESLSDFTARQQAMRTLMKAVAADPAP